MTIDQLPSIKAFCVERLKTVRAKAECGRPTIDQRARIEELELIIALCDGLEAQTDLLKKVLGV